MNYSIQKLIEDFIKKIGEEDLKTIDTVSPEVALNYVVFLYRKFYSAYPTGDVYEILVEKFAKTKAA